MVDNSIRGRVQEIFRDIFDDDTLCIQNETNSNHIEDWDSLNHINLVTSIEKEFSINFKLGELESLKNVGEMLDLIVDKVS